MHDWRAGQSQATVQAQRAAHPYTKSALILPHSRLQHTLGKLHLKVLALQHVQQLLRAESLEACCIACCGRLEALGCRAPCCSCQPGRWSCPCCSQDAEAGASRQQHMLQQLGAGQHHAARLQAGQEDTEIRQLLCVTSGGFKNDCQSAPGALQPNHVSCIYSFEHSKMSLPRCLKDICASPQATQ